MYSSVNNNVLEPIKTMRIMLIRVIMQNYYRHNHNTQTVFYKLKIFTTEQQYNKLSVIKIFMNKNNFDNHHK